MALAWPWVLLVVVGIGVTAAVLGVWWAARAPSRISSDAALPISRAERVRTMPTFRRAVRRHRMALVGVLSLAAVSMVTAGVIVARPQSAQVVQPVHASRDIMLCLDVSGSMSQVDLEVLAVFDELLDGFEGERIGLTIFNSSPVQVVPLTDDYDTVAERLTSLQGSFDYTEPVPEHWAGTLNGTGSSLIGDGLAACAVGFDKAGDKRSRSIILATDNEVFGSSIVSLQQAAAYAREEGIKVFTINPFDGEDATVSAELSAVAELTGGAAYGLRETTTVPEIITSIRRQEATAIAGEDRVIWTDDPDLWILGLCILGLVAGAVSVGLRAWRGRS